MAKKKTKTKTAARRRAPKVTRARVSTRRLPAAGAAPLERSLESMLESDDTPPEPQPRSRGAGRPETVQVILDLLDVTGRPIHDPETFFTFRRVSDNHQVVDQLSMALAGASPSFALPAAAGDTVVCEIDPTRYRFVHSEPFFTTPGPPVRRSRMLMREPREWAAKFTRWNDLSGRFADLKRALELSPNVTLFRGTEPLAERLAGSAFDGLSGKDAAMAKTTLLNIYFRLTQGLEPATARPWFSFVTRIVAIGQERLLAMVDPEMETRVREISGHIDRFADDYERTPAENHRRNVPQAMQTRITDMISIKSAHRKANFQLTLTHLTGPDEVLLDADLDESGDLLGHARDVLKHKITGGTHPHDIHELLMFHDGKSGTLDLGYRLV